MRRILHFCRKNMYLPYIFIGLLIFAFVVDTPKAIFYGLGNILTSPSLLTTDYIAVGGFGAALVNATLVTFIYFLIVKLMKLRMSGILYAAIMMIFGFSFFGKNIINGLPALFGVFLYSKVNKVPFKNLIIILLFSTGISPIVSYTIFGIGLEYYISIPLGIVVGIIAGFILPPLASHTMKFHQGYNLFNAGFALGIIAIFYNAILKICGINMQTASIISNDYHWHLVSIVGFIILIYIIGAFAIDKKVLKKFSELFKRSGRLVSDFERDFGIEVVLLNTAMILALLLIFILSFGIKMNGAVMGTMFAVVGFAGAGMHLRNSVPVLFGGIILVVVISLIKNGNINDIRVTSTAVSILFSLCLAPIAGRYGIMAGLLAGALHVMVVPLALSFQGGTDLYNNGFGAGFVACIIISVIEALMKEE